MAAAVSFADRLGELLAARKAEGAQAWLAKLSGLEPSTISRLLRGERQPTRETLDLIATSLGVTVEDLVEGTSAAERARTGPDYISLEQYQHAIATVHAFERRANDAETRAHDLQVENTELGDRLRKGRAEADAAQRAQAESEATIAKLESENARLRKDLEAHRQGLETAAAEVSRVNAQLDELKRLAQSTNKTASLTAFLAGIAAVGTVVTVDQYLRRDQKEPGPAPPADGEVSPRAKRKSAAKAEGT